MANTYTQIYIHTVIRYIENQPKHHEKKTFREEYVEMLEKFEVKYDCRYIFKADGE